jgi:hypothetical protein
MMLTLAEIETKVNELAQKIEAPQSILPTYGYSDPTERPHVEVSAVAYYYIVTERGQELSRYTAFDIDDLLYKIFDDITFDLSIKYEMSHRIMTQDSRRMHFQRQVELLSILSPNWAKRESQKHDEILKRHPYDDFEHIRIAFAKELREQEYSSDVIWKMACEKYPPPKATER